MSKYIKLEDALTAFAEACKGKVLKVLSDHQIIKAFRDNINNLPTIEVSEDCIDRKRFIEVLDETAKIWAERGNDIMVRGLMTAWTIANNAPSVVPTQTNAIQHTQSVESVESVEPTTEQSSKVGEWIDTQSGEHWKCSVCGHRASYEVYEHNKAVEWLSEYCPNCGARLHYRERIEE